MSEVYFSFLKKNKYLRIDTDFFTKSNLILDNMLEGYGYDRLIDISEEITDFGAFSQTNLIEFKEKGILFLRNQDVKESYINLNNNVFIDTSVYHQLSLHLKENDIVIPRVGTLGNAGIITKEMLPCSANQNLAVIRLKKEFNPFVLLSVLISNIGNNQIDRLSTGNVQQWLNLETIGNIKIPKFNQDICRILESTVVKSHNSFKEATQKYTEAETLLLENLGLQNFQAICESVNIKSLKESFLQTGRLDAEFYQPIYEQLEKYIETYTSGFEKLGNVCCLHDGNYLPKDNQEYDYIELSNIGKSGEITGSTKALGKELPSRARRKVRTNQVMISSIEGSLQSCAIVPPHYDNALCSTGFYVLSSEKINAETLLVLFKSSLMQQILKKNCSGTILTAINKEELLNIPLPIISQNTQEKIAEYIRQSNELREQAQRLLTQAKNSVEAEIENNSFNINELEVRGGGG